MWCFKFGIAWLCTAQRGGGGVGRGRYLHAVGACFLISGSCDLEEFSFLKPQGMTSSNFCMFIQQKKLLDFFPQVTVWLPVCLPQFFTQGFLYRMNSSIMNSSDWNLKKLMWDFFFWDFADPLFRKLQKTIFYYEYYLHFLLDSTGPSPAHWGILLFGCLSCSLKVILSHRWFSRGKQDAVSC